MEAPPVRQTSDARKPSRLALAIALEHSAGGVGWEGLEPSTNALKGQRSTE